MIGDLRRTFPRSGKNQSSRITRRFANQQIWVLDRNYFVRGKFESKLPETSLADDHTIRQNFTDLFSWTKKRVPVGFRNAQRVRNSVLHFASCNLENDESNHDTACQETRWRVQGVTHSHHLPEGNADVHFLESVRLSQKPGRLTRLWKPKRKAWRAMPIIFSRVLILEILSCEK